jgi:hypothetical protein
MAVGVGMEPVRTAIQRPCVEAVTGVRIGPHPWDDDDMTEDIVSSVLHRYMGNGHPGVSRMVGDIVSALRAYDLHRWG